MDKERLANYIQDLEGCLAHLVELQRYPEEEFLSDWRIHDLADRQLHLDHARVYRRVHTDPHIIGKFISTLKEYVAAQPSEPDECL
jgi:hypothetical protein